jgi:hypothetical protein
VIRDFHLSPRHFAAYWSTDKTYPIPEVNAVALALAFAVEDDPTRKEQAQMQLLECFHAFLMKYFNMIVFGQMPSLNSKQGKDAALFLRLLSPVGSAEDYGALRERCRSLHLAFRDCQESDEVYDVLTLLFLDICNRYSPNYTDQVKEVCDYIEQQPRDAVVLLDDVNRALGIHCRRFLTLLVKKKYLVSVVGPQKKIHGYIRGEKWPPQPSFFEVGPIGFTSFAQISFRYALKDYIIDKMKEIETLEGMVQLDIRHHGGVNRGSRSTGYPNDWLGWNQTSDAHPTPEGNWTNHYGRRYKVDDSMLQKVERLDLSEMSDEWVQATNDPLFKSLTVRERHLLQMVYAKDYTWVEIGAVLEINKETAKIHFDKIVNALRARVPAPVS